ncbi:hypothetical protein SCUCBS95973_004342 [Sporothrix curviconia]|uniref:Translation regulator n=1 Tax=Sporothrix curviconia TaxID=1260050 RepID=A0ABP0BMY4_9PEZI
MPLLDRTAAGLELSGLQRLLPKAPRIGGTPSKSLLAACSQRPATRDGFFDMFAPELSLGEPMHASAFLLDFLYPRGTLSFVRKLAAGSANDGSGRPSSWLAASAHRQRKSTQQPHSLLSSSAALGSSSAPALQEMKSHVVSPSPSALHAHLPTTSQAAQAAQVGGGLAAYGDDDDNTAVSFEERQVAILDTLTNLLHSQPATNDYDAFDRSWSLYGRLEDGPQKTDLTLALLYFISSSRRATEASRTLHLFEQLNPLVWEAAAVEAAIRALLLSKKDRAAALSLFRRSTATPAWAGGAAPGLDLLLADALRTYSWAMIADVWDVYKRKTEHNKAPVSLLQAVVVLPNLPAMLQTFSEFLAAEAKLPTRETDGLNLESLKETFKAVLEASLHRIDPEITFPLVRSLTNPRVLETFIEVAISKKRPDLAAQGYSEYRLMPRYKPRTATLVNMVRHVYYPDNARGMEDVLKDWYNAKGRPNFWGYQKYLAFYASRGDVTSVYRLWSEFVKTYPTAIESAQDTFAHLLKVHAVRGDVAQVEQIFSEIKSKYNVEPNVICWNIRLHVHAERGHAATAMKVFEDLCEAVQPDDYSFGTIMSLVGGRGDLDLVMNLYWLAQQCGVPITESIIDPIVEAYCQNDRHDEAERLCVITTREGKVGGKPYTALWNTLLQHHAYRHDLVAVNRILNVMTRLHVRYDEGTYSALLFAMAQCRQSRRAAELLRVAQEDGIFRPTAHHYMLLMMAYIRSKQPHRALQVNRLMHHMGFERSSQQIQLVIKAFSQWQEYPKDNNNNNNKASPAGGAGATERRELFAKALREFQRSLAVPDREPSLPSSRKKQTVGREAARMHLSAVRRFSFVIFMLVQARDFAGVKEVMQLYQSIVSDDERRQPLPLKLCNALMLSDFYEGRFDRVKEMWQDILSRTKEISRPQTLEDTRLESVLGHTKPKATETDLQLSMALTPDSKVPAPTTPASDDQNNTTSNNNNHVVAKLRYGLTDPAKTMQRLLTAERNVDGLVQLVNKDMLANGFLLDSKNWNHYVQNLARLGRTTDAFAVCEERLMQQWSGISALRARYRGRNDGEPAPTSKSPMHDKHDLCASPRADHDGDDHHAEQKAHSHSNADQDANQTGSANLRTSRLQQIRKSATRYNRPMTYTLMVLARAYLELEQMAMWSSVAERQLKDLPSSCPKSVHAVRAMVRMNSRIEGRVFGGNDDGITNDFNLLSFMGDDTVTRGSNRSKPSSPA